MAKVPGSGRKKGTPNKTKQTLQEVAEKMGVNPFEILCRFAANDWKALGYESGTIIKIVGKEMQYEDRISTETRLAAAKEACKYLHPQLKAIEVSTPASGIVVRHLEHSPDSDIDAILIDPGDGIDDPPN